MDRKRQADTDAIPSEASALEIHWDRLKERQLKDFRSRAINSLVLKHAQGLDILDVGYGMGAFILQASEAGFVPAGIDVSQRMAENTRACLRARGLDEEIVRHGDITEIVDSYSTVTLLDVIEHVENDEELLIEAAGRVRNGGRLIVVVPAVPMLFGPRDLKFGHFRRYNKSTLGEALGHTGLRISTLRYWNFIGLGPAFVTSKVLRSDLNDSFRFGSSLGSKILNTLLLSWLSYIENNFAFPLGLSLVAVAVKHDPPKF